MRACQHQNHQHQNRYFQRVRGSAMLTCGGSDRSRNREGAVAFALSAARVFS
jgi:hypothetical protein